MPLYEFACPSGHATETTFSLREVPGAIDCPECSTRARRRMVSPHLGRGSSGPMRVLDASARSAHEPEVVHSAAPGGRRAASVTRDPRHARLPRP